MGEDGIDLDKFVGGVADGEIVQPDGLAIVTADGTAADVGIDAFVAGLQVSQVVCVDSAGMRKTGDFGNVVNAENEVMQTRLFKVGMLSDGGGGTGTASVVEVREHDGVLVVVAVEEQAADDGRGLFGEFRFGLPQLWGCGVEVRRLV